MIKRHNLLSATLILILGMLAACQPTGDPPVVPATEVPEEMPTPVAPEDVSTPDITGDDNGPEEEVESAADYPEAALATRRALAQRLGTDEGTVEIVSVERRQWRDSCLGLGRADESCLQAITPGFLVQLETDGRTFEARTNESGSAVRFAAAEMPQARRPLRAPVVVMQRSGGTGDQVVEWRLYSDGRAEKLTNLPGEGQVRESGMVPNPRQLPTLLDELTRIGFFQLDGEYLPEDPSPTLLRYVLSVSSGDQQNSIEAVAGTDGVPAPVWESINRVESLMLEIFPEPIVE